MQSYEFEIEVCMLDRERRESEGGRCKVLAAL